MLVGCRAHLYGSTSYWVTARHIDNEFFRREAKLHELECGDQIGIAANDNEAIAEIPMRVIHQHHPDVYIRPFLFLCRKESVTRMRA